MPFVVLILGVDEIMTDIRINAERLWAMIGETAKFGGTEAGGVCRLTLTEEDRKVREWLCNRARNLGCEVRIDEVGNIFAHLPGSDQTASPVAIGSHLDTQATGGKFDGILGVLAGLEIFQTLRDFGVVTRKPLVLVNWTNEEGARFSPAMLGSGAHAGVFTQAYAESRTDGQGVTFVDALQRIGFRGAVKLGSTRFSAMFELHIEQGPVLERENVDIGLVTGVQAMRWYDVTFKGREAHAGTTPIEMRNDALVAAAEFILSTRGIALEFGGLATTGQLEINAASRNVVPGEVRLTLDLRHEDNISLDAMEVASTKALEDLAGPDTRLHCIWSSKAVRFDDNCIEAVKTGAERQGVKLREIVSGAGHDAVYVSQVAPTAMIFIPCKDGLSHNPAESATLKQCEIGAQTMLNAVLAMAS